MNLVCARLQKFSAVADALLWCMYPAGTTGTLAIHCMEDFFFFGSPVSGKCGRNLAKTLWKPVQLSAIQWRHAIWKAHRRCLIT